MQKYDKSMDLCGKWDFVPGHLQNDNIYSHIYKDEDTTWSEVEVPYCWNGSKWMSVLGEFHVKNGYYKDGGVPPFKDHKDVGWYRKKILLPEQWKGLKVHIRFTAVAAKAYLWVNGSPVGEHLGAYSAFQFDITQYVEYDKENTIVIKVWGKHCFYPHDQRTYDDGGIHLFVHGRSLEIPVGETRDNAGICQPVELFATEQVYIEDVHIPRSVNPVKIKVKIAAGCRARDSLAVSIRLKDKNTLKIVWSETRFTQLPEYETVVTFICKESDIKLWSPENPQMYCVEAEIVQQGRSLGMVSKDTGFKEFAIINNKFHLNGKPYFLRGAGSPVSPVIMHDEEYIFKFLKMCKELNLNCIRYHTEPPSQAWMKGCDELGLLAIYEMPLMQQTPDAENTRREFKELVRQAVHHPCVAIYCLSNETEIMSHLGIHMAGYSTMDAYYNDLRAAVLEEDDTLPVYHNAGYNTEVEGGNGDIRDWHIYGGWYDNCIISFEAIMKGTAMMELLSPCGGALAQSEMLADRRKKKFWRDMHKPVILTELLAAYTADDGHFFQYPLKIRRIGKYKDEGNEKALWFQAFLMKEIGEILRRCRDNTNNMSGFAPFALFNWFFHPLEKDKLAYKPAALALKEIMEPLHVSIRCWDRHKFGGEKLETDIFLINDDPSRNIESGTLTYVIRDEQGRLLMQGQILPGKVAYYDVVKVPLCIQLPEIYEDHIINARLEVVWEYNKDKLSMNTLDLLLAPSQLKYRVKEESKYGVYLFDSTEKTRPVLDKMEISYKSVQSIEKVKEPDSIIVIGMDSLDKLTADDKCSINQIIKNGASVLVLEQDVYYPDSKPIEIDWIDGTPISILREEDQIDDFVYIKDFSLPVFKGLIPEHFRMWNGNTVIISSYIKQGTEENHVPAKTLFGSRAGYNIRKLANVNSHAECYNFLRYDGLIDIPLGKGRVIFNQLEACRRYGDDPVATIYLNNLLNYVLSI